MKKFKKVLLVIMLMLIIVGSVEPLTYARTIKTITRTYNPNKQEEWVLDAINKLEYVQTIAATISFVLIIVGCIQFAKYHKLKSSDQTEMSEDEINMLDCI